MKYLLCKHFNKRGINGDFNLDKGSTCNEFASIIFHNNEPICFKTSQDAFEYFARNDDDKGYERFDLSHEILNIIAKYVMDYNDARLKEEEAEDKASKCYEAIRKAFPRFLKGDLDIFSFEFYEASIEDLEEVKQICLDVDSIEA